MYLIEKFLGQTVIVTDEYLELKCPDNKVLDEGKIIKVKCSQADVFSEWIPADKTADDCREPTKCLIATGKD